MVKKKNICLMIDQSDVSAYLMCKILFKSKYFKFSLVIFRNKNTKNIRKFKKFLDKDTTKIVSSFIHKEKKITNFLKKNKIELAISLAWHNRLRKSFLNQFSTGVVNFHPSPLPLNRGCHSTFWGIYNDTHHGSTMHFMDENWDWGQVIDRIVIPNKDNYFADFIFKKSRMLSVELLKRNCKNLYENNFKKMKKFSKKDLARSSYHKKTDIKKAVILDVNQNIKVKKLWSLIKATKFKKNGYFIKSGKNKYFIRNIISKI